MHLNEDEIKLFYKLFHNLVWHINERHHIIDSFPEPVYGTDYSIDLPEFIKVRNAMWDNPIMIGAFLAEDGHNHFAESECAILRDWQNNVLKNKFIVMKHLAKYSVVATTDENPILYAVHGIVDSFEDVFPFPLPCIAEIVLLPFMDRIIYDSLMVAQNNIRFGPGLRARFNNAYKIAKAKYGIVETLTGQFPQPLPPAKKPPKSRSLPASSPALPDGVNVPKAMAERYLEVASLIEDFCDEILDDEGRADSLRALQTLCRKRPSPVGRGSAESWACGIICAIGVADYRLNNSEPLHVTRAEVADWFGVSISTAANKSGEIRKLLMKSFFCDGRFFF